MPGHQLPQPTGRAGDQHRPGAVKCARLAPLVGRQLCPGKPGPAHHPVPDGELLLAAVGCAHQCGGRDLMFVEVNKHEPAGILRCRGAHESPYSRLREPAERLARVDGNGTVGDKDKPRRRESLILNRRLQ